VNTWASGREGWGVTVTSLGEVMKTLTMTISADGLTASQHLRAHSIFYGNNDHDAKVLQNGNDLNI